MIFKGNKMGFDLIEAGDMLMRIRRRHRIGGRNRHYKTGWGPLMLLLAVIIWIIGFIVTSRQAESRQKSTMRTFTSIAIFVVFISFIVDAVMAKE